MSVTRQEYGAFGLSVESEFHLPELTSPPEINRSSDLVIRRGSLDTVTEHAQDETTIFNPDPSTIYLLYDAATVAVREGQEIVVDTADDVPSEIIRHLIVGPALNYVLHQRGYTVLHASTVSINGSAVAFVGESGQGKTTTAAAFLWAGHRVLSDDIAAIRMTDQGPIAIDGYPSIKLDPAVVNRFDLPVKSPSDTCHMRDRHFYKIDQPQTVQTFPVERIYFLEDGDKTEITTLPPAQQIMTVVENTYSVSMITDPDEATLNFRRSAALANRVPVQRLQRPRQFSALEDVVELVLDDFEAAC